MRNVIIWHCLGAGAPISLQPAKSLVPLATPLPQYSEPVKWSKLSVCRIRFRLHAHGQGCIQGSKPQRSVKGAFGSICLLPGLPRSGKKIWKMKFFLGQGKVREFCGWSGKFRKNLESQGKVREFENKWLWQADLRKFIYFVQKGKYVLSREIV